MSPKERVHAAMNLEPVDKIPLMCQMSIGHMLLQLRTSPVEFWFDKDSFVEGLIKLREKYGFDGILVSLHGHSPNWRADIADREEHSDGSIRVKMNDGRVFRFPTNDLPELESEPDIEIDFSQITESDLPQMLDYIPVSQNLRFAISEKDKFGALEDIVKKCGDEYSVHGEITSPFDYLLDLIGHQNALMALIDDPEKCKMILRHYTKLISELAAEMCATGIDAIKISSPFAGAGFISPEDYREFVFPYEREIVGTIRNQGKHVYIHTCGAIDDRLEIMFETGTSGIECLDPPPLGNVELNTAFGRIGDSGFIKGNIDSVNTLLFGDREMIVQDAQERLNLGKAQKGFILSTACSIAPGVDAKKIVLLREAVDKWG